MREIGLLKDKFTNYWIKRMDVFHQDIATATNVIVRTDSTFHLGSRWKEPLLFRGKTILPPLTTDQLPV